MYRHTLKVAMAVTPTIFGKDVLVRVWRLAAQATIYIPYEGDGLPQAGQLC